MPKRLPEYQPTLNDHWLVTEWSDKRSSLPSHHGTEAETVRRLYDRVGRLQAKGWRVTTQKRTDDLIPGKKRTMVRVAPPPEYAHCGDSVIEHRSCGGQAWCKLCQAEMLRSQRSDTADRAAWRLHQGIADLQAVCQTTRFVGGICQSCGATRHNHARPGVSTSRHGS